MSTAENIENKQTSVFVVLKDQPTMKSPLVTTFECMSNELLMEIFDLLDWYSLYFSFSSLNSRLNALLAYCHNICVDLDCIPPNTIASHLGQHLPSLNPHQIRALRSSINWNIKLIIRDDFNLSRFIFIRSLILIKIKHKTAQILFEKPIYRLLTNLIYLFVSFVCRNRWIFILSVYPKLCRCILPNATFSSDINHLQSNTVQSLHISHAQSNIDIVATSLLVHSSHLRRLNLHVAPERLNNYKIPSFVRPSFLPSSKLSHLTVHGNFLYFSSIEWLLAYAPHLRMLHVRATSSCERIIKPNEWEQVLPSGIKRLDVEIKVKEPITLPSEIVKNNDFWQSRKWHVTSAIDPYPYLHMYS